MAELLAAATGTTSSARSTSSATRRSTTPTTTSGSATPRADRVWERYFEWLGEAARTGMFDILAHPDLVKMWGRDRPAPEGDLRRFYERAMDGIAESGVAVEVSTAGLRKPTGELYPATRVPGDVRRRRQPDRPVQRRPRARPARVRLRPGARGARATSGSTELAVFERRERRLEPIGAIVSVAHRRSATTRTASRRPPADPRRRRDPVRPRASTATPTPTSSRTRSSTRCSAPPASATSATTSRTTTSAGATPTRSSCCARSSRSWPRRGLEPSTSTRPSCSSARSSARTATRSAPGWPTRSGWRRRA